MGYMYFDRVGEINLSSNIVKWNYTFIDYFLKNNEKDKSVIISRDSVEKLIRMCDEVLEYHKIHPEDITKVRELLPSSGVYDDEYYNDVSDMRKFLRKKLLKEFSKLEDDNECIKLYY